MTEWLLNKNKEARVESVLDRGERRKKNVMCAVRSITKATIKIFVWITDITRK